MNTKLRNYLSALLFSSLLPSAAHADFLSISAGGGIWSETPDGSFYKAGDTPLNVKDQLLWDEGKQGYAFATLEHFVPLVPNAKIIYTRLEHGGSGNGNFTFNGVNYNGAFSNDLSMETLDLLLYYEVLDNVVSLDLGLNLRTLNIDYSITDSTTGITDTSKADSVAPMIYVLVGASPLPDLIISGELSYLSYDGNTMSDFTAKIAYTTSFFVGFEAGYRRQELVLDDIDSTFADLTFAGPFAGAYVKF